MKTVFWLGGHILPVDLIHFYPVQFKALNKFNMR